MTALRTAIVAAALGLAAALPVRAEPARDAEAASPWTELHASRARLVAGGVAGGVAGATAGPAGARHAGLEIVLADGWKTYWRMPGDAGVPPQFDWSGSSNVAQVRVLYPAPKRMAEAGGHVIGYKQAVLFPIEVTPKDAAKPVALRLALEFGICREICVPGVANLELALPPARKTAHSDAIGAALDRVPRPSAQRRPSDPDLLRVSVDGGEGGARLNIAAAFPAGTASADVFVEAPDSIYVPMPRRLSEDAGGVVRFASDLPAGLARDLRGKTLTLTLVSEAGATETQWKVP
jgi:DsbC/DsbD-like thiol-disulfide interchange protein